MSNATDNIIDGATGIPKSIWKMVKGVALLPVQIGENLYDAVHKEDNKVVRGLDTGIEATADAVTTVKNQMQELLEKIQKNNGPKEV